MTLYRVMPTATLLLAAGLTGCTVFPDREPPRVMDIPIAEVPKESGPAFGKSVRVDTPQATEPLDSSRILAKATPSEFQVYGQVRWRDTAPVLVRELMIGTLRRDGRFSSVVNETSPTASDLTLASDLYGFHSELFGDQTRVTIAMYSQVMDNRSRETVCQENFDITVPAADDDIEAIVASFKEAGNDLSQQMRDWLGQCLNGNQ